MSYPTENTHTAHVPIVDDEEQPGLATSSTLSSTSTAVNATTASTTSPTTTGNIITTLSNHLSPSSSSILTNTSSSAVVTSNNSSSSHVQDVKDNDESAITFPRYIIIRHGKLDKNGKIMRGELLVGRGYERSVGYKFLEVLNPSIKKDMYTGMGITYVEKNIPGQQGKLQIWLGLQPSDRSMGVNPARLRSIDVIFVFFPTAYTSTYYPNRVLVSIK